MDHMQKQLQTALLKLTNKSFGTKFGWEIMSLPSVKILDMSTIL
jgi:hypothetical protein